MGICTVFNGSPILMISHAVNEGIRKPEQETYMIAETSLTPISAWLNASSITAGTKRLD
jgi:hypothetical protein